MAVFAAGGRWGWRAPVAHKAVAQAPAVDLEQGLPAFDNESQAGIATAGSIAPGGASAVAVPGAATRDKAMPYEDCGDKDSPQSVDTGVVMDGAATSSMTQVKAAGTHYVTAQSRVDLALRASSDPFDRAVARQCQAISDVMYEHGDGLLMFVVSGNLQQQVSGDASRRESVKAERARIAPRWGVGGGISPCETVRGMSRFMLRSAQIGELAAMRERARDAKAEAKP